MFPCLCKTAFFTLADYTVCIWNIFLPGVFCWNKSSPRKAILLAGNFHLVLGQANFNLPIALVTFFFVLLYLLHYTETRVPRCTTDHVPNYVLPLYLDRWDWLLPSWEVAFHGQKMEHEDHTGGWGAGTGPLMNRTLWYDKQVFTLSSLLILPFPYLHFRRGKRCFLEKMITFLPHISMVLHVLCITFFG